MCQEDNGVLNIKGCHPKCCIMHYFLIIPTYARPFLSWSFDDNLTCKLSEIIKANNLVKKFLSSGIRPNAKDLQRLVFCINTYPVDTRRRFNVYKRRKGRYIRKHLCGKRVNQGARTVLGGNASLKIVQIGIPKDISLPSRWSLIA